MNLGLTLPIPRFVPSSCSKERAKTVVPLSGIRFAASSKSPAQDRDTIEKMLGFSEKILSLANRGEATYLDDQQTQDLVHYHLILYGEMIARLSADFRQKHPQVNWRGAHGLRCVLVHQHDQVQPQLVWEFVTKNSPSNKRSCKRCCKHRK